MVDGGARVFAYHFDGYWQDVGTIESYWETNLDLLDDRPGSTCTTAAGSSTRETEERAPALIGPTAQVDRSMVSHGCVIHGTVVHSVLSPGVRVDDGAVVRDSIVMFDTVIRAGAVVDRAILDKEVVVGPGAIVGDGADLDTPNKQEPDRLYAGITLVGKRAVIPRGTRIGRNVKVAGDVKSTDFSSRVIKSGASVEAATPRTAAARLAAAKRRADARAVVGEATPAVPDGKHSGNGTGPRERSIVAGSGPDG